MGEVGLVEHTTMLAAVAPCSSVIISRKKWDWIAHSVGGHCFRWSWRNSERQQKAAGRWNGRQPSAERECTCSTTCRRQSTNGIKQNCTTHSTIFTHGSFCMYWWAVGVLGREQILCYKAHISPIMPFFMIGRFFTPLPVSGKVTTLHW